MVNPKKPGLLVLMGSGETSPVAGQVLDFLAQSLPVPLKISILETPAGFELNSDRVAGRVADYFFTRLQNYSPQVNIIAARKKGTPYSPDNLDLLQPIFSSHLIFLGPGSPSYAVRQLQASLAWEAIRYRFFDGSALVLSSAAAIALGTWALPVYEIHKVGEDPFWKPGLDFFRPYGLQLAIMPHWNNRDGGSELDTSHCFMGQTRFDELIRRLPPQCTILGIDEQTAMIIDLSANQFKSTGRGALHILHQGCEKTFPAGCSASLDELGPFVFPPLGFPFDQRILKLAQQEVEMQSTHEEIPLEIKTLLEQRRIAYSSKDWSRSDQLRLEINHLGWEVGDTPSGQVVGRKP